jgi:hypothetical protein
VFRNSFAARVPEASLPAGSSRRSGSTSPGVGGIAALPHAERDLAACGSADPDAVAAALDQIRKRSSMAALRR